MTPTKTQLATKINNFKDANGFNDKEVASIIGTDTLTVFRIRRQLCDWIDFKLLQRLTMILGE